MKSYLSLRFDRLLSPAEASSLANDARDGGWEFESGGSDRFARSYVLLSAERGEPSDEFLSRYSGVCRYEQPLLALSIEPEAVEALPFVASALNGSGGPEGVLDARIVDRELLIEFFPSAASWRLLRAVIDVELQRYGSSVRRTTLLSPLTAEMQVRIAADGLREPDLDASRVLEALMADADR